MQPTEWLAGEVGFGSVSVLVSARIPQNDKSCHFPVLVCSETMGEGRARGQNCSWVASPLSHMPGGAQSFAKSAFERRRRGRRFVSHYCPKVSICLPVHSRYYYFFLTSHGYVFVVFLMLFLITAHCKEAFKKKSLFAVVFSWFGMINISSNACFLVHVLLQRFPVQHMQ